MDLLSLLLNSMTSSNSIDALSNNAGTSPDATSGLVSAALPLLLNAMTSNASTEDGALSLLNALGQHNDSSDIASQLAGADMDDGNAIIGHILGNNTDSVVEMLAGQNGVSNEQASSLLGNLAPALLSSLSAATNQAQTQTQDEPLSIALPEEEAEDQSAYNGNSLLSTLLSFLG